MIGKNMKRISGFSWSVAAASLAMMGGYAAIVLWVPAGVTRAAYINIFLCILPLFVNGALLLNTNTPDGRENAFWMLLALGCSLWLAGQSTWTYIEVYQRGFIPELFLGDIVFFLHTVPMIAALAIQPHKHRGDPKSKMAHHRYVDFALMSCWWVFLYVFIVIPWQYIVVDRGRYTQSYTVVASLEKITPTLDDAAQLLRVLARSATGQDMSVYTTFSTGPRRPGDPDGPEEYHVILLDNGRSAMLAGEFSEMLRCIRCGACMNHCPVYQAVGGHAYGSVYPGPMGAVLTPSLVGVKEGGQLPNASTFCGRCEEVCPMRIPLPKMMRHWREREFERHLEPTAMRYGLGVWAFFAKRPALYRFATGIAMRVLGLAGRRAGRFSWAPFAGGWTRYRDLAAPQGATFQARWRAKSGAKR